MRPARYGIRLTAFILAGGAMYLWQQQVMQNSGQGTDEATAISAGDTNSATASPPPDDDKKEDAEKKIDSKSVVALVLLLFEMGVL